MNCEVMFRMLRAPEIVRTVLIVETVGVAINEDNKMEEEINFDEITIDDYCNTDKGRADVFCKQEL